jgi:hypothetical protein
VCGLLVSAYVAIAKGEAPKPAVAVIAPTARKPLVDSFLPDVAPISVFPGDGVAPLVDGNESDDGFVADVAMVPIVASTGYLPVHLAALHAQWATLPAEIDGVVLAFEGRSTYVRRRVRCPNPLHVDCNTSRSLTMCRSLGQLQVFGFLGAWISAASDAELGRDRDSHMAYRPTLDDIGAWLRQRRYLDP